MDPGHPVQEFLFLNTPLMMVIIIMKDYLLIKGWACCKDDARMLQGSSFNSRNNLMRMVL